MDLTRDARLIAAIKNHQRAVTNASYFSDFTNYMEDCSEADDKLYQDAENIMRDADTICCPCCGVALSVSLFGSHNEGAIGGVALNEIE